MRLLIVDDDPKLRSYVTEGLTRSGHDCATAPDGEEALRLLEEAPEDFDLILLDVMLPQMSGWDLLEDLRARGRETPVIFVTARDEVEERVKGLRLGADDYVIKPFAFRELLARIEAVIRSRRSLAPIRAGDLTIDMAHRRVRVGERAVELSPREFDLLRVLAKESGHTVSRTDLLREVWDIDFEPGTNVVEVHVGRLRRKLGADGVERILTVRGQGYRLSPPEGS